MGEASQPQENKGAKSGVKDGETPNTSGAKAAKRPVDEEDTFGGAERARKGKPVGSGNAKP